MIYLFNDLNVNEKNRILEMHTTATKKNYLNEQQYQKVVGGTPAGGHPVETPLYKQFISEVEGDGVSIIKSLPNQLVIDGISGTWTISYTKTN